MRKPKGPIFDLPAETTSGAVTDGRMWVRATVFVPPELETLFREQVVIKKRKQEIAGRKPYNDDPVSAVVNACFNAGLREYGR